MKLFENEINTLGTLLRPGKILSISRVAWTLNLARSLKETTSLSRNSKAGSNKYVWFHLKSRLNLLTTGSSSNSKHSPNNSPRRLKISRSRSRTTSARTDALLVSSTNRRTMQLVLLPAFLELRSNVTMLSRLWFFNKKLLKSSSVSGSATRRNCQLFNILMSQSFVNGMRPSVLFFTFAA